MTSTPDWVISQRRARGECITCGQDADGQVQCDECWLKVHGESR